mmetsp:Transcript_14988/g.44411  ORF Transcript_14988/g.44411 Transcript_14988/m.44411 type:complete len:282 (-) Transcript_14988:1091-1936(-)
MEKSWAPLSSRMMGNSSSSVRTPLPSVSALSKLSPQAAAKLAAVNLAASSGGSCSMILPTAARSSSIWLIMSSMALPSSWAMLAAVGAPAPGPDTAAPTSSWWESTKLTTIMVRAKSANSSRLMTPFLSLSKISANWMQWSMVTAKSSTPERSAMTGRSSSGVKTPLPSESTRSKLSPQAAAKLAAWNLAARSSGSWSMMVPTAARSSRSCVIMPSTVSASSSCCSRASSSAITASRCFCRMNPATSMVLANSANSSRVITPFPSASKSAANLRQWSLVTA